MAIPLTINGVTYQYPQQFDLNWGPTLTNWSTAVTNGMLQKAGGTFTLTAEVNFGTSFGLKAPYFKSSAAGIASTGVVRLANASSGIVWRNQLGNADLALTVNSSNQLTFNGTSIGATTSLTDSHILVGNASNQPADVAMTGDIAITNAGVTSIASGVIVDADVNASAAIAISKLATLTASRAVVTDGSGVLTPATTTATEIGYVNGVTSAIQTQLNTLTTNLGNYLPLAGGTMSGAINMGSNKITSVTSGTNTGEAVQFGQLSTSALASNTPTKLFYYLNTSTGTISSATILKYDTQVFDVLNEYSASTGLFTPVTTGYYFVQTNIDFEAAASTGNCTIEFYNNTGGAVLYTAIPAPIASGDFGGTLGMLVSLTGGNAYAIRINYFGGNSGAIRGGNAATAGKATNLSIFRVF